MLTVKIFTWVMHAPFITNQVATFWQKFQLKVIELRLSGCIMIAFNLESNLVYRTQMKNQVFIISVLEKQIQKSHGLLMNQSANWASFWLMTAAVSQTNKQTKQTMMAWRLVLQVFLWLHVHIHTLHNYTTSIYIHANSYIHEYNKFRKRL